MSSVKAGGGGKHSPSALITLHYEAAMQFATKIPLRNECGGEAFLNRKARLQIQSQMNICTTSSTSHDCVCNCIPTLNSIHTGSNVL
jgi:hypothetical protein